LQRLSPHGLHWPTVEEGLDTAALTSLLEYKDKKINKRVPLVLTYHPSLEKMSGIVRHHWKEIQKSETLTKLFPEPPVVAFRGVFLVRSLLCPFILLVNGWTLSPTYLRPVDVTVKEVNHIMRFAIDIAKDFIFLSCRLPMEQL
jgi:hypothetical protein